MDVHAESDARRATPTHARPTLFLLAEAAYITSLPRWVAQTKGRRGTRVGEREGGAPCTCTHERKQQFTVSLLEGKAVESSPLLFFFPNKQVKKQNGTYTHHGPPYTPLPFLFSNQQWRSSQPSNMSNLRLIHLLHGARHMNFF